MKNCTVPFRLYVIALLLVTAGSFAQLTQLRPDEINIVAGKAATVPLRVLLTTSESDTAILRAVSVDVTPNDPNLQLLADRMLATVNDVQSRGVGIAAPQIGINRNVVWVQRYDKPGQPFELFINPKINWYSEILRKGNEGCLSIPDLEGEVYRSLVVRLTYYDRAGQYHDETIEGFTAVILQHECDHLMGILFPDRLELQQQQQFRTVDTVHPVFYMID